MRTIAPCQVILIFLALTGQGKAIDHGVFREEIEPILAEYCYDCHGDGADKGGVALDEAAGDAAPNHELWLRVLKNVRSGIMPPAKKPRPDEADLERLVRWLKYDALELDADHPDPGSVTIRRLNRVEYRNTIRDLMGVDFDTEVEFPPDDTGYGFDNIGDVLTMSPLLAEKVLEAAKTIVAESVPTVTKGPAERFLAGTSFTESGGEVAKGRGRDDERHLSFYEAASLTRPFTIERTGDYKVVLTFTVRGSFDFDPGRTRLRFEIDGERALEETYQWQNRERYEHVFSRRWEPGSHYLTLQLEPLTPEEEKGDGVTLQFAGVRLRGPMAEGEWVHPENYGRFFPDNGPPEEPEARRHYTRRVIADFMERAYRRPPDESKVEPLLAIAESGYQRPEWTYERAVSEAFAAILASPRFLYRIEEPAKTPDDDPYPLIDEYALASRLSYFLWSTMPDDTLLSLARRGALRHQLPQQVRRLLADERSREFVHHFTGQWLQVRDVDLLKVDERRVLARDAGREEALLEEEEAFRAQIEAFREARRKWAAENERREKQGMEPLPRPRFRFRRQEPPAVELDGELRQAFRGETLRHVAHIVSEDRSILELIDSDYTFLNERLARHYGIPGVEGPEMRLVKLPEDSVRGGVLTHGSVLLVTSNPTRTSPVKRGLFVLENFLGNPPPPPPADVPSLEEAEEDAPEGRQLSMKEALEQHRRDPLCQSCHQRMDPLGFALENFNALGMWRTEERQQPIDASGTLITGEPFTHVRALKRLLRQDRRLDFYRCFTEKLFTYALGRGTEVYDVETIDRIVGRLEAEDGKFSAALLGLIESAPFQRQRKPVDPRKERSEIDSLPGQPN